MSLSLARSRNAGNRLNLVCEGDSITDPHRHHRDPPWTLRAVLCRWLLVRYGLINDSDVPN
jgi:hypothetical protein